jgi:LysR family glycine cleavage system transcriptional activator
MARLPPLAAVRAFEAAARYQSFTKAAEELFVTQSAISRHIRHLEDWLGTPLFVRKHRGLVLTPEGEQYRFEIASVFRRLTSATNRIKRSATGKEVLNIHSFQTFAMLWLLPRLPKFQQSMPDVELRFTAGTRPIGTEQEQVHALISIGPGTFESSLKLFPVTAIPVCTPDYAAHHFPERTEAELSNATLLHSIAAEHNWEVWAERSGFFELDIVQGMRFDSSAMAIAAAERHMGVAIAQFEFVQAHLSSGAFVAPFPSLVIAKRSYYLSLLTQRSATVLFFRDWLLAEVEAQGPLPDEIKGQPLRVAHEV